jgi:glutathione synthase/RimK-type ligase-like ATP-grasp enzyme
MSGIDVRRTSEGEYVFLEANPAPMFMHFERMTGYPVSDRLAKLLGDGMDGTWQTRTRSPL